MSVFAGVVAKRGYIAPHGQNIGYINGTITLTGTTYVNGDLDLSALDMVGINPENLKGAHFTVGGSTGYMVTWTRAATPVWTALGTLKLYSATGTEATGSLTLTIDYSLFFFKHLL